MKTFRFIGFALFAILMCLSACSGGGDEPIEPTPKPEDVKSEITIDSNIISNGLSFSDAKGEQSISFTTNENWTLNIANTTSGATWCTASTSSGTKGSVSVKFTVTENTDYENRSVSVTIKAGTASKTFTITQKSADALLVTTDKYEVGQKGGTIEIEVKANIDYQMEISEAAKDWITESSGRALSTYKHKLDISMNENAEKREGEIIFKSGDKSETVKVFQTGGTILLLSQDEFNVSDRGDTISVDIKSNIDFGVQMPDVDWIVDEASSRGMSSHTLKYAVVPNEGYDNRSAEIIFYDKNSHLKDTLKIFQTQKDAILVTKNEYVLESVGGNLDFSINTNVDFEVSISVDWIKHDVSSRGLIEKALNFIVEDNKSKESREGEIIFACQELKQTVRVLQKGMVNYEAIERAALTEFYSVAGGDSWVNNTNWCSDRPLNEWFGISTMNGRITHIQLPHNGLEGIIPESFFALTEVEWINLEENNLSGDLSEKFGNFTNCKFLGLARNNFTGSFPKSFRKLVNLTYFSLFKNKLSGLFPLELMQMPNWNTVIKDRYAPQQIGFGFEWPATQQMINLGDGIYMHPDGVALEYRVNELKIPSTTDEISHFCKNIYKKVTDSFDFIFFVFNSDQLSDELAGREYSVSNSIKGIGQNLYDCTNDFGSKGLLKSISVLTDRKGIYSGGPFLHELCHYWGAINIGQERGDSNGFYYDYSHWGISDVHGQLGGFDYATLETNVDGNPNKYKASSYWGQTNYNKKAFPQAGISNITYAPLELYLMGLIPASEVPEMHIFRNVRTEGSTLDNGIFYADSQKTITIDDIINKYGERIPDWKESQKDFRGLIVVLSEKKVSDYDWQIIKSDILIQELQKDDGNSEKANFWEATGGRAILTLSGIDKFLKQ